jgi:hypothetical protein
MIANQEEKFDWTQAVISMWMDHKGFDDADALPAFFGRYHLESKYCSGWVNLGGAKGNPVEI